MGGMWGYERNTLTADTSDLAISATDVRSPLHYGASSARSHGIKLIPECQPPLISNRLMAAIRSPYPYSPPQD